MIARWSTDVGSVHQPKTLQFRLFFPKIKILPIHANAISPQQITESQAKRTYTTIILSK